MSNDFEAACRCTQGHGGVHKLFGIRSRSSRATQCSAVNSRLHSPSARSAPTQRRLRQELANQRTFPRTADPALNDIVHYRDAFTFDGWLQSSRRRYSTGYKPSRVVPAKRFGVREIATEFKRDQQCDKGALDERPHTTSNSILRELCREFEQQNGRMSRACRE